jgi:hypothetical protein
MYVYANHLLKKHFAERCERFVISEKAAHLIDENNGQKFLDKLGFKTTSGLSCAIARTKGLQSLFSSSHAE